MRAILEFNLPEDQTEYDIHNQASMMQTVLLEFENYLIRKINSHSWENADLAVLAIRRDFLDMLEDYGVKLN